MVDRIRVSINNQGKSKVVRTIIQNSTTSGSSGGGSANGATRLVDLTDVTTANSVNGAVPVWNTVTQKADISILPLIDNGTF